MIRKNTEQKMMIFFKGKRTLVSAIFLFTAVSFLNSCKKEVSDIGLGIQPDADLLNATVIDTFQIESTTEFEDSLRTDELSTNMLGSYVDPIFGKASSDIYTQFGISGAVSTIDIVNTTIDSVKLQIRYSGFYGELDPQTFSVKRITEKFFKDSAYYSNDVLTTDGIELIRPGFETITPDVSSEVVVGADTLNPMLLLDLDTTLGSSILNSIAGGSLLSETAFNDFFYGLHISVNNVGQPVNSGGLFYFDMLNAQTKLVVYYTENTVSKQLSFPVGTNQARFSHFEHDYTGTPVEAAMTTPALGQQFFYAQTMSGVQGAIKIKGIDGLKELGNVIINKAELYLPVQYYTADPYSVSPNAFIFYKNAEGGANVLVDQLSSFTTYGGAYDNTAKAYVFNIGRHIQQVVKGDIDNLGYILNTSGSSVSGGRIVFSGQSSPNREKPYLKVYYTKFQ
jgi:Domain of unknown function (DUF4270)